jgi:hypothetical protein
MKTIFIAYADDDASYARELQFFLRKANNVEGWMDSADIAAGSGIAAAFRLAIKKSSAMVVLVSRHSVKSHWIQFEVGAALALEKPVIPILIEGAMIQDSLQGIPFLDARGKPMDEVAGDVAKRVQ